LVEVYVAEQDTEAVARFEEGLRKVAAEYPAAFAGAGDEQALRAANARFAGPQGELTQLMKLMPKLPGDRRRELGQRANAIKQEVQKAFEERLAALARAARQAELSGPPIDVTLPGRGAPVGKAHPIMRVRDELLDVFLSLGFDVADGPEVDFHEYNFDKLGFPPDHPATDMQDSFYIAKDAERPTLLRTHTSTIQVREMLERKPPLAVVAPGAVYRRDDDATHSPMFFQLEGLLVDEGVSFAHLKGVLTVFAQRVFGPDVEIRVRPSYFPFVEPGGEVDVTCLICRPWEGDEARTRACRVCKGSGWLEVLGCGMVHPVVFEHVGYDPERWGGFAFGMGIDRIAMLKYGIPNIRLMYENDLRFLSQL
jgi:phenylalanyl-tRNA synthetase alpha chain